VALSAGLFVSLRTRCICGVTGAEARNSRCRHGSHYEATTKAGCAFLLRLIALHGLAGAARVLRALADELGRLAGESSLAWDAIARRGTPK
jgi:hypothetical protein